MRVSKFMHKYLLFLALLLPADLFSQVIPIEGSRLNYRVVGFSYADRKIKGCRLEVAEGNFSDEASFIKHIVDTGIFALGRKKIVTVPDFGKEYTWRVVCEKRNPDNVSKSEFHHFSTLPYGDSSGSKTRLRIVTNNRLADHNYFFVDATRTLYNAQGDPVWFLPDADVLPFVKTGLRDLKYSNGTMTCIMEDHPMEIDYNGNIRWRPYNTGEVAHDTSERFHHELTKLQLSGQYMVLGTETIKAKLPSYHGESAHKDSSNNITKDSAGVYWQKMEFGTLIAYDTTGKVTWAWKSFDYFKNSEIFSHYLPDGKFPPIDVHENAFCFNERDSVIYVGFRNISRILKIKYPSGNVLAVYGLPFEVGSETCSELFCGQHSISLTSNGDLCLYNNNSMDYASLPKIEILKEVAGAGLAEVWKYDCTLDGFDENELDAYNKKNTMLRGMSDRKILSVASRLSSGGIARQTPDGSIFVSMGHDNGKLMLINENKEVLWSAVLETQLYKDGPWISLSTYRANIVSWNEIRGLIWSVKY